MIVVKHLTRATFAKAIFYVKIKPYIKFLWTIENRDAIWPFVGGVSKAFQPPKPSPSRQYAHRKLVKDQEHKESEMPEHNDLKPPSNSQDGSFNSSKPVKEPTRTHSSPLESAAAEKQSLDTTEA